MSKRVRIHEKSLAQLAYYVGTETSPFRGEVPTPGSTAPTPNEMMRAMLEMRMAALHAALQIVHTPETVLETARMFTLFLQQG